MMAANRRDFLKLMGAGAGAALLSGITGTDKAEAARSPAMTESEGKAMLYDALSKEKPEGG